MSDTQSKNKNKKYLIIPAAGKSSRFSTDKPKYLLTHPHGILMVQEVISGIDLEIFDECHIVILKEHCDKFDADIILDQALDSKFKITILDEPTTSSPHTVVECIKRNNISGQVVVKDCDCFVSYTEPNTENYIVGLDVHEKSVKNLTGKSFILSENGIVVDIIEKKIVSDTICVGVYSMDSDDILSSFDDLHNFTDTEIYFSNLISLCIERGSIFELQLTSDFIDWGTSTEWFEYTSNLNTFIFDIDGVFLENRGRYGKENWSNFFVPIEENIKILKHLSDIGSEIIFITSRTEEYLQEFKDYLLGVGINYKTIISGCNHNKRILVNDFYSTNPYPSCEAINIPRNGNLKNYYTDFIIGD